MNSKVIQSYIYIIYMTEYIPYIYISNPRHREVKLVANGHTTRNGRPGCSGFRICASGYTPASQIRLREIQGPAIVKNRPAFIHA